MLKLWKNLILYIYIYIYIYIIWWYYNITKLIYKANLYLLRKEWSQRKKIMIDEWKIKWG